MLFYITSMTPTTSNCAFIQHAALCPSARFVLAGDAVYNQKKYLSLIDGPLFALQDDLTLRGIQTEPDVTAVTMAEFARLSESSNRWITIND